MIAASVAALAIGCVRPPSAPHDVARGEAALAAGQPDEARDFFRYALDADPTDPRALHGLARAQLAEGELAPALETFRQLERADPVYFAREAADDRTEVWLRAAEERLARGDPVAALELLRRIDAADPDHPSLPDLSGRALVAASGRAHVAGRRRPAGAWLSEGPGESEGLPARRRQAERLLANGEVDTAISALSNALLEHPDDPELRALLAQALDRRYPDPPCFPSLSTCEGLGSP